MISSLRGRVITKKLDGVVVEVGGVGYHVQVPPGHLADIPEPGQEVFLHIHTLIRDDTIHLYGFPREEERRIFSTLMGISGIGPRIALAIVSGISVERFIEAVHNEDLNLLSGIPGLGKKTAARIVLELKGKLPSLTPENTEVVNTEDAVSALINLGYKKTEAEDAVKMARKEGADSVEEIIKKALSILTGQVHRDSRV